MANSKPALSFAQIVQGLAEDDANEYRRNFPRTVEQAVTDFRSANNDSATPVA
jgi:hypothetical protein